MSNIRDERFCYKIIVAAAQAIDKQNPSNKELLEKIREVHKRLNKRMPNMKYMKPALKAFRKAGTQLPTAFS